MKFKETDISTLKFNPFDKISRQWMLVTAGDNDSSNTMTASWGGVGIMWGKPVATVYIRPQRYTKEFIDKNEYFKDNQIIRVLDQIGNDIAALFNDKYLGKTQNNKAGRLAFWNEIVTYNRELERLEAITDFVPDDVTVEQGSDKNSVVVNNPITPVSVMTKLYMTCVIS